ncbi:MAG: PLP-dependent aminotransferase family protein [Pseudomonadota bacterium]
MENQKQLFRYESLAKELETKIQNGTYRSGDKLPSIREFHHHLNLSISTVYKAFIELEAVGLIEARPKSGYYVSPPQPVLRKPVFIRRDAEPRKVDLSCVAQSIHNAIGNPEILPLGGAIISPELFPYKHFSRIVKGISANEMKTLMAYAPGRGIFELRRQIAMRTVGIFGKIDADDVIITNGCMEALALSLQAVVKPGDTIAIETPTFFTILRLLEELGVYVLEVPTDPRYGVDPDELEKVIAKNDIKACLFMPNFQNPLGALMPDSSKKRIVDMLNRENIPIIEDDIYAELYFGKKRPGTMKKYDAKGLVMSCSSFSKTLAPGLRIGWILADEPLRERVQKLKSVISISSSNLDQYVMSKFLESGGYDRHLRSLRKALNRQVLSMASSIQKHFPHNTRLAIPEGGAFLWVGLPGGIDGLTVFEKAMENNIAVLPGIACSASDRYKSYLRINCGYPFLEPVEEGIAILGQIIKSITC